MSFNPWDTDPKFINIGGLNNILTTNKKFCAEEVSTQVEVLQDHESLQFINALRELSKLNKEQVKISLDVKRRQMYQDFYNVLNTDVLDGLISMVDYLSNHLQHIIDNKNKLIKHLHQPYVGKPIAMDAKYQSVTCDFFPLIATDLAELLSILNNLEWVHNYSVRNSGLSGSLHILNSSLATVQHEYESMVEVRDLMNGIIKTEAK